MSCEKRLKLSPTTTSNSENDDSILESSSPYQYQSAIVEQAKTENLIVCLPTGSGKTFIAVMLIKELSLETQLSFDKGGKRSVLLVKTVDLARQHYETICKHIDEKYIAIFGGSSKLNVKDPKKIDKELEKYRLLIFTAQVFLNLLVHNHFSLDKVNLLIFDECHHGTGNDPYARIMIEYYEFCSSPPRILGLTASISGQKLEPDKLQKAAKDLEKLFHSRIETGSDQIEIARNSTSVTVKHKCCFSYEQTICSKEKTIRNMFKEIKSLCDELEKRKIPKNEILENHPSKIDDQLNFTQLQYRTLDQLKSDLDNIGHIGSDLGLRGFSLGIKSLRNYLNSRNVFITLTNQNDKDLYNKIKTTLDKLIANHLTNLPDNPKILDSDKVIQLEKYIRENSSGQTIVFTERIYTAAFLCQVLKEILPKSIKIKYLAGSKARIDDISVSARNQREVADEFRHKDIHVLISTAIIEEGLDVSGCNLVIRFNKPQNFSSYMQSKGRARAKDTEALFVVLRDENDPEVFSKNKEEYENYEYMEKMLRRNFKTNNFEETSDNDDFNSLPPFRPGNGIKIGGINAVQIIYQYCAVLRNGQESPPRFCFYLTSSGQYKCVLSMPKNCPIGEKISCENKNKKIAKQDCCLKMIEKLYQIKELDERCLPKRPEPDEETDESSDEDDDENKQQKTSVEAFDKQSSCFPLECSNTSTHWYLYKINNDGLGFIVPCEINKLPIFKLYGSDIEIEVEIIFLKLIDLKQYEKRLEEFCRYIFEQVFDNMNTGLESILKFNMEQSNFKLFPCLLDKFGELDYNRMESICNRKNKLIQNPSELNNQEVYIRTNPPEKQLYINASDDSVLKRSSDPWEHKKAVETVVTYADHFEYKIPGIRIRRDYLMGIMKTFKKPRINYLRNSSRETEKEKKSANLSNKSEYYPIELLGYAPLNQIDFELIYKLPSILIRISQLYYIEQLRKLLANAIQSYSLLSVEQMPLVIFQDCLPTIFSSTRSTALPLVVFNYDLLSANNCKQQLSPGLLFQSITRHSTAEITDMENLEILGDCFLKLAMSMSLYHQHPNDGAGKLTPIKDKQVSNKNLYRLATNKQLKNYLYANEIKYGGKEANWIPPGYTNNQENSERYLKQKAKQKAFADMIEALIGAFLLSTDYITTIKFMNWLGLGTIPKDKNNQIMQTPSVLCPGLSITMNEVSSSIQELFSNQGFVDIEKKLNYHFKNKAYLIAAFTHPSYSNNYLTQCYERLEYLGDAVLDFLVIRCIFVEYYDKVTPQRVTDIRQDLSNNGRLAHLLVSCGFQKKILHSSPYLFCQITGYVEESQSNNDTDINGWADPTAPKALADVFEALVGAIFLDSGCSLEIAWKIIEPLLRQYIQRSVEHPNLNPIRSFKENKGEIIEKSIGSDGYYICRVKLPDGREFIGRGRNTKLARHNACQKAMNNF